MAAVDIKAFLRLQTDAWLMQLRDKVAADLLENVEYTALNFAGKSVGQRQRVSTARLAAQLAEILVERDLAPTGHNPQPQMTIARFA